MKNQKNIFLLLGAFALLFVGCERTGYLIDGGVHDTQVDMTTYDFLTTNPIFDSVVMLIDKAGLKETINGDVTFFVPTDYTVKRYLDKVSGNALGQDAFADSIQLDDIPIETLQDSLLMYIIPGKYNRDDMTQEGEVITTNMGNEIKVSLVPSPDLYPYTSKEGSAWWEEYPSYISTWPEYVYYTYIVNGLDDPDVPPADGDYDVRHICQTSGIETTNGVIHVLENTHTLFFYVQTYFPTGI